MSYQNLEKIQPAIAAPRPGYAAPIDALNLSRPDAAAIAHGRSPEPPKYTSPSPTSPHPLNPPITPITPAFARPPKIGAGGVTFKDNNPIMRSNTEETLLPKRGEKGDDFWRRFSMVAKEEDSRKPSSWLRKTQNGTTRMSRWVWVIGLLLVAVVAAAIGLGWYLSHNSPAHQQPKALGGTGTNRGAGELGAKPAAAPGESSSARPTKVTPTFTVERRAAIPLPTPDSDVSPAALSKRARIGIVRHRKGHKNRSAQLD